MEEKQEASTLVLAVGKVQTAVDILQTNIQKGWHMDCIAVIRLDRSIWQSIRQETLPGIGHFDHTQLPPWEHVAAVFFFHFRAPPPQTHQLKSAESYRCSRCILYIAASRRDRSPCNPFTAGGKKQAAPASYTFSRHRLTWELQSAGSLVSLLAG